MSAHRAFARSGIRRVSFAFITAAGFLYRLKHPRRPEMGGSIEKILVVRLDLLGDVVFSLTLAEAMRDRYPRARITMLTLPYTAPVVRMSPAIDEVVSVDTNRIRRPRGLVDPRTWLEYYRVFRDLRDCHFDLAISVYGAMGSLWAFLAGARRTTGYRVEAYPFLLDDPIAGGRHEHRIHEIEYVRRLAIHAGARGSPDRARLIVPEQAISSLESLLSRHGVAPDDRIVVVHAGSVNGSAKRWPEASWGEFADVITKRTGARVVLAGAESDGVIAEIVQEQARSHVLSLTGQTSIPELAALLLRADLVASGDSGPLHLASALGRPLLAVYGPTDPKIYGPYPSDGNYRLHRRDLACSPCYTLAGMAECPLGDPICMRLVSVAEMTESAAELLGTHR